MPDMTRRTFVAAAAAVTGAAALAQPQSSQAAKPLRILILGGTGFIGPFQVRYAVDRGHKVTVFNRGKTNPDSVPAGVERLQGDRSIGPLDALKGREWDVVIDNPWTLPRWVRDAATLLKGSAHHSVFISTISVYKPVWIPPVGETAGFGTHSIKKAPAAGLTFRPVADTAKAAFDYHESRDAERKAKFRAGIKPEREAEVLALWRKEKK